MTSRFNELVGRITEIGREHHQETILENSRRNAPRIEKTIRDVARDSRRMLIASAGPSLYRQSSLTRFAKAGDREKTCVIATDGAYIQCLKAGIVPDYVVTIDPHPTRIVRWFGDPNFEENSRNDDYFSRQDLDISFRKRNLESNRENIGLVDDNRAPLVIASSAPESVVERTKDFERYWFAPLVDDPRKEGITREIIRTTGLPALNTGGTVGSAAWNFARTKLLVENIAVVGMDFGYYADTPLDQTQEWNILKDEPNVMDFYPPEHGHWNSGYTSPTYYWYRQNFLDLLKAANATVVNCSEGGFLYGDRVKCMGLGEWLESSS